MSPPATSSARAALPWLGLASIAASVALAGALAYPRKASDAAREPTQAEVEAPQVPGRAGALPRSGVVERAPERSSQADTTLVKAPARAASTPASAIVLPLYPSPAAELGALRERLPGERVTLEHRGRSLDAVRRALGSELDAPKRAELEAKHASLELKQRVQTERVARIEQRIELLERP